MLRNLALLLLLTGCTVKEPPKSSPITVEQIPIEEAGGFLCNAQSSQSLIGKKVSTEIGQMIINLSGAQKLRWIPPNTAITRDLRNDRINIHYNNDNIIEKINCG